MTEPYEVDLAPIARRALAEKIPFDVAMGVGEFVDGPLAENPHRVGKQLNPPLNDAYSARVMRDWRVIYVIDEESRTVVVTGVGHRRDVYRT